MTEKVSFMILQVLLLVVYELKVDIYSQKGQHLEWGSDAISGVYLCPYFLALTSTGIEVHNSWRYQRIQVILLVHDHMQKVDFSSPKMIEEYHFSTGNQSGSDEC